MIHKKTTPRRKMDAVDNMIKMIKLENTRKIMLKRKVSIS